MYLCTCDVMISKKKYGFFYKCLFLCFKNQQIVLKGSFHCIGCSSTGEGSGPSPLRHLTYACDERRPYHARQFSCFIPQPIVQRCARNA